MRVAEVGRDALRFYLRLQARVANENRTRRQLKFRGHPVKDMAGIVARK